MFLAIIAFFMMSMTGHQTSVDMKISQSWSVDSLGACQGVSGKMAACSYMATGK